MTKDIVNLFPHIGCFGSVTIRNIHMAWLWTAESVGLPNVMHIMMISSWSQQKNYIDSAQEGFAILSKPILGRGLKTTTSNISILLACLQQDHCGTTSFVGCPRMMSGTYGCGYIDLSQYALTLNGSCVCINGQLDRMCSRVSTHGRLMNRMIIIFFCEVLIIRRIGKRFWVQMNERDNKI